MIHSVLATDVSSILGLMFLDEEQFGKVATYVGSKGHVKSEIHFTKFPKPFLLIYPL